MSADNLPCPFCGSNLTFSDIDAVEGTLSRYRQYREHSCGKCGRDFMVIETVASFEFETELEGIEGRVGFIDVIAELLDMRGWPETEREMVEFCSHLMALGPWTRTCHECGETQDSERKQA